MKIVDVHQIREADQFTIQNEPISSVDLMERAATACVNWLTERFTSKNSFIIICGNGNNGGDGLAIARLLTEKKFEVTVFVVNHTSKKSADFEINLKRLPSSKLNIQNINVSADCKLLSEVLNTDTTFTAETIIIDALLGSGLNRPVNGTIADVISCINAAPHNQVIALDVPSGLYCDQLNAADDLIVIADYTLTFQFPKLTFMFPETAGYVGEFTVLDIGLSQKYIDSTCTKNHFIIKSTVIGFLKTRDKTAHKGNFGHALLIAGSYGKIGAAVLSAKASLKTGAGLLTVQIPKCGYEIMQVSIPEAMVKTDEEINFISNAIPLEKYNAIGIGPGIGLETQTQNCVKQLIQNAQVPLVFDADALNCIAENKTWLPFIPAGSIFTPHPKEFERLTEKADNSAERLKLQRDFSLRYSLYVVLKGAHTAISCPNGDVYFNSTGNPGMATAGSGDVLTGIITSLIAQGYSPLQSCIMGVYIHGLAGDFAAELKSEESMIASDIIDHLSDSFIFLKSQ